MINKQRLRNPVIEPFRRDVDVTGSFVLPDVVEDMEEAVRIVSLLPSATEIVYALGLGESLVGITHECDFPADARTKPIVTRSMLDHTDLPSTEIDKIGRAHV